MTPPEYELPRPVARSGRGSFSLVGALLLTCILGVADLAHAHGRPPSLQRIVRDPTDAAHVVAQATWGLASTVDGGASWQWSCAAAYDVDPRMEDPRIGFLPTGALYLTTFGGLYTTGDHCGFASDGDPSFGGYPIDLASDASGGLFVAINVAFETDELWYRDPSGAWALQGPVGTVEDLVDTLVGSPSDPTRLYTGGGSIRQPDLSRRIFIQRSSDAGRTFETTYFEPRGEEYAIHVLQVDPANPDVLWAVTRTFDGEAAQERLLRSVDGGATLTVQHELPQLLGFAIGTDGHVWAGSALGGLFRSSDGGETFERISETHVRCLHEHDGAMWICGDPGLDGHAIAVWNETLGAAEPLLELSEILQQRDCPTCTDVGVECPSWLPDIVLDLGLDPEEAGLMGPLPDPDAGSTGAPRDAGLPFECGGPPPPDTGCGCRIAPNEKSPTTWAGLILTAGALVQRRRRRRSTRPSRPSKP